MTTVLKEISMRRTLTALFVILKIETIKPFPFTCLMGYVNHDGLCCGAVWCNEDYYIEPCRKNWTNDTCVPCPPGTFQRDQLTSEILEAIGEVVHCQKREECPTHTVPSSVLAPEGCRIPCRCHLEKHFCGDPCNCQRKYCSAGYVLLQNCGCLPPNVVAHAATVPSIIQSSLHIRTLLTSTTTSTSTSSGNIQYEWNASLLTTEIYRNTDGTNIDQSDKDDDDKGHLHVTAVIIVPTASVLAIIIIVLVLFSFAKRKTPRKRDRNVFNIQAQNLQVGNHNTMLAKDIPSSTDALLENGAQTQEN